MTNAIGLLNGPLRLDPHRASDLLGARLSETIASFIAEGWLFVGGRVVNKREG